MFFFSVLAYQHSLIPYCYQHKIPDSLPLLFTPIYSSFTRCYHLSHLSLYILFPLHGNPTPLAMIFPPLRSGSAFKKWLSVTSPIGLTCLCPSSLPGLTFLHISIIIITLFLYTYCIDCNSLLPCLFLLLFYFQI